MANKRKKFSPEGKVRLLRLHLIEKEPVSDICDRNGLNPNVFYRWQKIFFENGTAAFAQTGNGRKGRHSKEELKGRTKGVRHLFFHSCRFQICRARFSVPFAFRFCFLKS